MPVLLVGSVVYLPVAVYSWWRIGRVTQADTLISLSLTFPYTSSLLTALVFTFPELVGGSAGAGGIGRVLMAFVGLVPALVVGYLYVAVIWGLLWLLKRMGVVVNEFAAR